jgi:hypothetical protein
VRPTATQTDIYGRPLAAAAAAVPAEGDELAEEDAAAYESIPEPAMNTFKVYTVHSSLNVHMPWTSKPQEESTGSGFAVAHQPSQTRPLSST